MRLNAFLKILCLFASAFHVIWTAGLETSMINLKLDPEVQRKGSFYVPDSALGGMQNFDRKYLTLRTPDTREAANDFSLRLIDFIKSVRKLIWHIEGCYETGKIREYFINVFVKHEDFKCQAVRRSLIYGILYRFKQYKQLYEYEAKNWRNVGFTVVDILKVINEIIPEVYFETGVLLEEAVAFAKDMNEFVAFAWKIDFYPLYQILKEINYASIDNPAPLKILITKGDYLPALKMLLMKEATLNPNHNLVAWMALVEIPETDKKIQFLSTLIRMNLLNFNWRISQGEGIEEADLITLALNSKFEHYKMIMLILSSEKLERSLSYYFDYANDPLVSAFHSDSYSKKLVNSLRDLVVQSLAVSEDNNNLN